MKRLLSPICVMVMLLMHYGISHSAPYNFSGVSTYNYFGIAAFIDGTPEPMATGGILQWYNNGSWFVMDVDAVGLSTTLIAFHNIQSSDVSKNNQIEQQGFGGLVIPFTLNITESWFHSSIARGPYSINPSTLEFGDSGYLQGQNDGAMWFAGSIDMEGQKFPFEVSTPARLYKFDFHGTFDDSNYPEGLGLSYSGGDYQVWGAEYNTIILQTTVEGHDVELRTYYVETRLGPGNFSGSLVPIPSKAMPWIPLLLLDD